MNYCLRFRTGRLLCENCRWKKEITALLHRTMEKNESGVFWKRRIFVHGTAKKQSGRWGAVSWQTSYKAVISWYHGITALPVIQDSMDNLPGYIRDYSSQYLHVIEDNGMFTEQN